MTSENRPKILIVDDERLNLTMLNELLKVDYKIFLAKNGQQALERVKNNLPDLILLDIMMPEMDGYETCRRFKENIDTKEIPIVFLSAKTEKKDLVKGFEIGGADYVTKPFNSAELLARIKVHVGYKRAKEEIKTLRGIIPICAKCKNIRTDEGIYTQIESYIENHSEALFSHGLCPDCSDELYGDAEWYRKRRNKEKP
ncbi:MAG: response regulator [Proteobacteria bacterium]|nr:response regulator [Pseudomonadota bacterium]